MRNTFKTALYVMLGAILFFSAANIMSYGCATTNTVIAVAKDCAVQSGKAMVPDAILEIEQAVALASTGAALAALESLGAKYGTAFVSCVVDRIVHEAANNMARGADDSSTKSKAANGAAWLVRHPL